MRRPDFVSDDDIARWSKELDNDTTISSDLISEPILKEVCLAGMWLNERLEELGCPVELITRIQFGAGRYSYGRDIWMSHKKFLDDYNNGIVYIDFDRKNMN